MNTELHNKIMEDITKHGWDNYKYFCQWNGNDVYLCIKHYNVKGKVLGRFPHFIYIDNGEVKHSTMDDFFKILEAKEKSKSQ